MKAAVRYSIARLGIFALCFGGMMLIPALRANPIVLVLLAGGLSMVLSLLLLARMRDAMAREVAAKVEARHLKSPHWQERQAEDVAAEQREVDSSAEHYR